jgi:hypothetical protein
MLARSVSMGHFSQLDRQPSFTSNPVIRYSATSTPAVDPAVADGRMTWPPGHPSSAVGNLRPVVDLVKSYVA